jgi:hypothetical protein
LTTRPSEQAKRQRSLAAQGEAVGKSGGKAGVANFLLSRSEIIVATLELDELALRIVNRVACLPDEIAGLAD